MDKIHEIFFPTSIFPLYMELPKQSVLVGFRRRGLNNCWHFQSKLAARALQGKLPSHQGKLPSSNKPLLLHFSHKLQLICPQTLSSSRSSTFCRARACFFKYWSIGPLLILAMLFLKQNLTNRIICLVLWKVSLQRNNWEGSKARLTALLLYLPFQLFCLVVPFQLLYSFSLSLYCACWKCDEAINLLRLEYWNTERLKGSEILIVLSTSISNVEYYLPFEWPAWLLYKMLHRYTSEQWRLV